MRVRAPASIANIGPGFDCLAMAIDLWLEVEAVPAEFPSWDYEGEGSEYLMSHVNPFSHLAMKGRVRSEIPIGVGLGGSGGHPHRLRPVRRETSQPRLGPGTVHRPRARPDGEGACRAARRGVT